MVFTLENIDDICEDVCSGCGLVKLTNSGIVNGEPLSPPEYNCPLDGDPKLIIDGDEVFCDLRKISEDVI